jgi:hypothetical protein
MPFFRAEGFPEEIEKSSFEVLTVRSLTGDFTY